MSKENTNKIENNYSLSHTYHDSLVYNTKDSGETNSPSPQLDMESLLSATRDGKFKIQYDFSGGYAIPLGIAHANEKQLFFSELQEVYKRVDAKEARKWLEQVEAFLDEDWGLGKDFAVRSRPSFVVYQNDFGWNLDQFVDDYRTMGDKVFELAYFSTAFAGLGDERRRRRRRRNLTISNWREQIRL